MATDPYGRDARTGRPLFHPVLQLVTAAALAVSAAIHADLAPGYDAIGAHITQGTLFRLEAAVAALSALLVLAVGHRRSAWVFAATVSASALGALLLYRYVDVGALGPLPNMYEPAWFPEKTTTAIAEAVGTVTAIAGFLTIRRTH